MLETGHIYVAAIPVDARCFFFHVLVVGVVLFLSLGVRGTTP
jgi:hypothetical protein